ncbi:hypothetical protein CANARDRAFT_196247 [[Candida] arabinofermentans NRRL YB-2248]|uniref:non-specific serine/threonine protein kinase n=1 Tax=[Candida] arabinofermentans NRRL YB-2248 TaxID=983967 RepID=A0A1E4T5N4_9ASCO|nr:hypothetical protein CANARDRAFT_196247 [[Candida] arabinofermentans NRRL YB-2248]
MLSRSLDTFEVTNLLLSSDIEGNLHALNRNTGELVWTLLGNDPLVSIVSDEEESRGISTTETMSTQMVWMIEPFADGSIYYFTEQDGLQKLPTSIKQLVQKSPFSVGDDFMYTGIKRSGIVKIDARTGELIESFGLPNSLLDEGTTASSYPIEDESSGSDVPTILLGKTTYELSIHSKNGTSWNITYSSWGPNNLHAKLVEQNFESIDNLYIQPFHDNSLLALDAETKSVKWVSSLPFVTVNVFDVFLDRDDYEDHQSQFIVIPHPLNSRPALPNSFSSSSDSKSTFIDRTNEGSWFAMSEYNYPSLVKSAPLAKYITQKRWRSSQVLQNPELLAMSISGVHDGSLKLQLDEQREKERLSGGVGKNSINSGRLGLPEADSSEQHYLIDSQYPPYGDIGDPTSTSKVAPLTKLIFRAFENVLVTILGIAIVAIMSRLGLVPPLTQILSRFGLFKRTQSAVELVDLLLKDDVVELEKSFDLIKKERFGGDYQKRNKEGQTGNGFSSSVADDQKLIEEDLLMNSQQQPKKRKRGSRGGKKNKKKDSTVITNADENNVDMTYTTTTTTTNNNHEPVVMTLSQIQTAPSQPQIITSTTVANNSLSISNDVLGYGSHGTVVFKGSFEKRPVAVKRMLIDFYDVASHEINLLQESDDHPNVVRYFCSQQSDRFLYIALELCEASLEDVVENKKENCALISKNMDPINVLLQIANGLNHLHSLKIVHRDIKPQNILVVPPKKLKGSKSSSDLTNTAELESERIADNESPIRLLISDFGLCKKLEHDQSSFRATTAQAAGTAGWRAPELLIDDVDANSLTSETNNTHSSSIGENSDPLISNNRRLTRSIDIFSAGCVFYYVLTSGAHPFGDRYLREGNIIKGDYNLDLLDSLRDRFEAKDLVESMIAMDPNARPDMALILKHPYFWSIEKKLEFLLRVSDRFEVERRDPPSAMLLTLEAIATNVLGEEGWFVKFDPLFMDNLGKYRKYNTNKLMDLLRAMRNKYHHYQDMPAALAKSMSPLPDGFYWYFVGKFPNMLMQIYKLVESNLKNEETFRSFF